MENKTKIIIGLLILLLLVVSVSILMMTGFVMWQLGVFSSDGQSTPPGCAGFSQIFPLDTRLDSESDTLNITLNNDAGFPLILKTVTASIGSENPPAAAFDAEMRPGELKAVDIGGFAKPQSGEDYRVIIDIEYVNKYSGISHHSTGECWGRSD